MGELALPAKYRRYVHVSLSCHYSNERAVE